MNMNLYTVSRQNLIINSDHNILTCKGRWKKNVDVVHIALIFASIKLLTQTK